MSFILDALTRGPAWRGRKTAALAHGAAASPALAWQRRRFLWRIGGLVLAGAFALAIGLAFVRVTTSSRAVAPAPSAAASGVLTQAAASIPAMAPFPKQQASAVAKFKPPTTLSQPLPQPGPVVPGSLAWQTPPRTALDEVKPLNHLPADLQAVIAHMKVRLHVYAPQRRQRFVLVDDRQLREGDDLLAGVRLDEITQAGMVLRHKETRVLAPAPAGR